MKKLKKKIMKPSTLEAIKAIRRDGREGRNENMQHANGPGRWHLLHVELQENAVQKNQNL